MERLASLSKEVIPVWAGRSNAKYEVREKRGPRKDNGSESWDDRVRERKWSWGRRREEDEKWNEGRGEITSHGWGSMSIRNSRDCSKNPMESWDQWVRERKLSWGKNNEGKVEKTESQPRNVQVPARQLGHAAENLQDIQVFNIPAAVPALEVKKICQNFGEVSKFRYYSMFGDLGSKGYK